MAQPWAKNKPKVAVVGAGVIGLSAALHLVEKFPKELDITVIAEKFSPETTSNKAAMAVTPPKFSGNSSKFQTDSLEVREKIKKWSRESFKHFNSIFHSEENGEVQLSLRTGYEYKYCSVPDPFWSDIVFGFRHVDLTSEEGKTINAPPNCTDVWAYSTYIFEPSYYLKWMEKKFQLGGGTCEKRKIENLDELDKYDIIVNCTGLGSHQLLKDYALRPSRGQVLLVRAPWISHFFINLAPDGHTWYICPRPNGAVVGGTAELDNWNQTPDPKLSERIMKECRTIVPSLAKAEVIDEWVGLRPVRNPVRLDSYEDANGALVVNCYGHGGNGAALSWGCAVEIGDIITHRLHKTGTLVANL